MSTPTTCRTVIVCLPPTAGNGASGGIWWLSATATVAEHTDTPADLAAIFPVRRRRWWRRLHRGHRANLLGVQTHGRDATYAAGGRADQLDLPRAGQAAWLQATAEWATWRQVTTGLKPANSWQYYQRRHRRHPDRFSLPDARQAFTSQPAVAAMLAHNAVPGARQLDPYQVESYQAGQRAHATARMLAATCGQAMLTCDGKWLQPAGDSFADQLAYLKQAAAHLHQLPPAATVVALTT